MNRVAALLAVLLVPAPLHACLWDRDTLAAEAKGIPDIVQVITGRFERNPPLYYELRLQRAAATVEANPDDLAAYDDAGVACDRLGLGDDAIAWMEKKRDRLHRANLQEPAAREHLYRYLANVGTFLAHRWFRQGRDRKRIAEMETARDFIQAAIELNPDAHFGREEFQLMAMEWVINPPETDAVLGHLPSMADSLWGEKWVSSDDKVKGLAGLIVLGDAWQSVDVFHALAFALIDSGNASVAYLATLRCYELIDQGRGSLLPIASTGKMLKGRVGLLARGVDEPTVKANYARIRAEADAWHQRRTQYMMDRLKAGRHPDTDPTFWSQWTDPGAPAIQEASPPRQPNPYVFFTVVALGVLLLISGFLFLYCVWHRRRSLKRQLGFAAAGATGIVAADPITGITTRPDP